jgi:hypothetical protein
MFIPRSITRYTAPEVHELEYFNELWTEWYLTRGEPNIKKPIAVSPYLWLYVSDRLQAMRTLWVSSIGYVEYPVVIELDPCFTPKQHFHITPKTWAMVVCFLDTTFDRIESDEFVGSYEFNGSSRFLVATMFKARHHSSTIQSMIMEADAISSDFWPNWFQHENGAIFYESIKSDNMLPLAWRIWEYHRSSSGVPVITGKGDEPYVSYSVPTPTTYLKEKAPAVYDFYVWCQNEAKKVASIVAVINRPVNSSQELNRSSSMILTNEPVKW